jgi:hypothetical protein
MMSGMPPLALRVSIALARHRFSDDRMSVDGRKAGRVAITAVADWLDELSRRRGTGSWFQRFMAQAMCRAVADILRDEAKR